MLKPAPILIAEDEESDVMIFEMAARRAGLANPLVIVRDGEQAVAYLGGQSPYADRSEHPLPALCVLDLKMPKMTGFDVLSWLRARPDLGKVPAVVLSSSTQDSDMAKARALGAADYHIKPTSLSDLVTIIKSFNSRWLSDQSGSAVEPRVG
jgi:CheY-like chemotaxis protein